MLYLKWVVILSSNQEKEYNYTVSVEFTDTNESRCFYGDYRFDSKFDIGIKKEKLTVGTGNANAYSNYNKFFYSHINYNSNWISLT